MLLGFFQFCIVLLFVVPIALAFIAWMRGIAIALDQVLAMLQAEEIGEAEAMLERDIYYYRMGLQDQEHDF